MARAVEGPYFRAATPPRRRGGSGFRLTIQKPTPRKRSMTTEKMAETVFMSEIVDPNAEAVASRRR